MDKDGSMTIKDMKTHNQFKVRPSDTAVRITMSDGETVRVYPLVLRTMIRVGGKFSAIGTIKNRLMQRLS